MRASWLSGFTAVLCREVAQLRKTPIEIIFCLYVPVFWMLVVWGLLGDGVMTEIPTGFVDGDQTYLSREVARAVDANRAVSLDSYYSLEDAMGAMRAGDIYGIFLVPPGYARDSLDGTGSAVTLYVDESRFAVAGTLQAEVASVISALNLQKTFTGALKIGDGVTGARRMVSVIHSDFFSLGNMQVSFLAFLGAALIPGVVMVGAMLGFVTAMIREAWHSTMGAWLAAANGSFSAALAGKLAPHFALYCLVFLFYMALFAGQGGFAPAGSLVVWFMLGATCLAVFAAMAILVVAISPNWRFALVFASGYAAPALPFTGFSIPLDSMGEYARAFSKCLPLTWFVQGQAQQWTLDAGLAHMGPTFMALGALFIVPLVPGYIIFKTRFGGNAKRAPATAGETVHDPH